MKQDPNQSHKSYKIALIGNPNCGKTTIFNTLTGSRQKIGNWPGVTVEKKTGEYHHDGHHITITDLPGIYSLAPAPQNNSIDQKITNDFINNNIGYNKNNEYLYINIIDSSNLKRNLYLTIQLLSLGLPCLVVLNMTDKALLKNINIDNQAVEKLKDILNCPVVAISANKNSKHNNSLLKNSINQYYQNNQTTPDVTNNNKFDLLLNKLQNPYFDNLIKIIDQIKSEQTQNKNHNYSTGQILNYLETGDINNFNILSINPYRQQLKNTYQEDTDIIIADLRYNIINYIYNQTIQNTQKTTQSNKNNKWQDWLDNIVLNKYLGIPIFLFVLYLTFEVAISLGEVFKPLFELPSKYIAENSILLISTSPLFINISQGISMGITTVAGFIPQISLMFIILTFLEDSGYMARAAFIMDRAMQSAGLPGKSFVPLIISFGCNVPAILSTRTLDNSRDRILTCLMSPFMSCSARLAIFIVFASAFFPKHQGLMVFILYITGISVALLTGLLLKNTLLTSKPAPFILELPSYNIPTLKNIFVTTWQRCKGFVIRAGKLIIPICLVLQLLNNIQFNGSWTDVNTKNHSVLATTSKTITPILNPIGITDDNWPATIGLITGSLAKEIVVGTLNTLYTDQYEDIYNIKTTDHNIIDVFKQSLSESYDLLLNLFSTKHYVINNLDNNPDELSEDFSLAAFGKLSLAFPSAWAAFAYCLFVLLYIPCLSTFSILIKEIGKNWAIASLIWSLDIAYSSAAVVYQASCLKYTPVKSLGIITSIILFHIVIYNYLKSGRLNHYFNHVNPESA